MRWRRTSVARNLISTQVWTKGAGKAKHVGFKKFLKLLHLIAAQKGIEDDKFVAAVVKRARIKTKKTVATSPVLGGRKNGPGLLVRLKIHTLS